VFTGGNADFGISVSNAFPTKILTAATDCNLFRRNDTSADDHYGVGVGQWENSHKTNVQVTNSTFQGWNHATGTVSATSPFVAAGPANQIRTSTSTCAPGAPRHVSAKGGHHRIKVTWRAPTRLDYAPVTGYRIKAKTKGHRAVIKTVGATTRSAVLKGLRNNRRYVVTVTAVSNGGKTSATARARTSG
jgi:hypothetical protein